MKKFLALVLAGAMIFSLAACGSSSDTKSEGTDTKTEETEGEKAYVAMVLSGDINDGGWCQSAYEGLMEAEKTYGVKVEYTEGIDQVNYESSVREYAAAGANLILAIGSEFADACTAVSADFPDTMFANFNASEGKEPNLAAYRYATTETGFVAGYIAATLSTSGVCGYVAGSGAAHIADAMNAYEAGVKYYNDSYKALTANTDSMTDVALAQETAQAMIDQGCDVILGNANTATLGVLQCAEENKIKAIGCISDYYSSAPDTVQVSVVQDNKTMVMAIVDTYLKGEFKPVLNLYGMESGAIYVSDWHGHDADLTDEQKQGIEDVIAGVKDGSLKEAGILPKSSFE